MDQPSAHRHESGDRRRSALAGGLLLTLVYAALVLPMILTGAQLAPAAWDESEYHLPIVYTMRDQWPRIDIVHYDSATTPGYHILMAGVLKATGSVVAVRLTSALLSWCLLIAAYAGIRRVLAGTHLADARTTTWLGVALALPLACSQYFLGAAIWLTTDNAALLLVVLALSGAILAPFTPARACATGVWAALAVLVRQLHVWLAAPIMLAAVLSSPLFRLAPRALQHDPTQSPRSWKRFAVGTIAALMPVAVVVVFVALWGALIPVSPKVRDQHLRGANPATLAFVLSLAGALGAFMLTVAPRGVIGHLRRLIATPWLTLGAGALGLLAAIAFPTAWEWRVRDTGLWLIVKRAPAILDRSVLLALLSAAGAVVLLALCRRAAECGRRPQALMTLLALLAWVAAQTANIMCWHRYFEPLLLVALAWLAAMGVPRESVTGRTLAWRLSGPLTLSALLLAVSAWTLYRPELTGTSRLEDVEGTAWKYQQPEALPEAPDAPVQPK